MANKIKISLIYIFLYNFFVKKEKIVKYTKIDLYIL